MRRSLVDNDPEKSFLINDMDRKAIKITQIHSRIQIIRQFSGCRLLLHQPGRSGLGGANQVARSVPGKPK
jgi:hypothetical protein